MAMEESISYPDNEAATGAAQIEMLDNPDLTSHILQLAVYFTPLGTVSQSQLHFKRHCSRPRGIIATKCSGDISETVFIVSCLGSYHDKGSALNPHGLSPTISLLR